MEQHDASYRRRAPDGVMLHDDGRPVLKLRNWMFPLIGNWVVSVFLSMVSIRALTISCPTNRDDQARVAIGGDRDLSGLNYQTKSPSSGNAGRPRQMSESERRGQLVAIAGEMFLQKGYRATTMDDIAQCAGMSKKTVYQIFSAKSELFDALLTEWLAPFTIPVEADGQPPHEVLNDVLCRLVNFALSERQISMTRLLIAEAPHSEDIAIALERQGIGRGKGALEQYLAAETARGTFSIDDPEDAANTLFFTAAGNFLFGLLLRTQPRPSVADVAARVKQTVTTFFQQII
jgi:AcrR family transcriptional regulator